MICKTFLSQVHGSTSFILQVPGSEYSIPLLLAMVYSLLATCKLHDINPYYWLRDVLENMHRFNANNIDGLLP